MNHTYFFALNAFAPLQDISHSGLDLAYAYFDPFEPSNDLIYLQEVKTTGGIDLSYADNLISDYRKLFGEDGSVTYNTRIQGISMQIELQHQRPDLADRLRNLSETQVSRCNQVRLIPTLVHERVGTAPVEKLVGVKSAITALGWSAQQVAPWSIAMTDLIDRLVRLSRGHR
ncbi:hypothetical protein [Rhizobium leguminosarum]|uniref:hypothetical protein n=1 Tax=Rhizobium leguminosarum TaxID=384 RepID=UPI00037D361E|nr:hypothetical protein [Rhizobium leguminosarum]